MSRAAFLLLLAVATACMGRAAEQDRLRVLPPGAVRLRGHLGEELALSLRNRILAQSVDDLVKPFAARADVTEWRSEFWGKWITSAIEAYRIDPDPVLREHIERAVSEVIATQTPDGYIGAYSPAHRLQRWDVWGRKYTLLGLLAWNEASGDPAALAAARREADELMTEAAPGKGSLFRNDMWNGMATSSVLEPMVLLYRRTGDARYLQFCRWLLTQWPAPRGPDLIRKALGGSPVFQWFPGPRPVLKTYADGGHSKAYEMMSCFEGLLELYRVTGDRQYAVAAKDAYANIRDTEITVIGSGSDWERWNDGRARQTRPWHEGMETCVTVTWLKFSAQLLRLTGDPAYADQIETTLYNALLGSQAPDASWWCHYAVLAGARRAAERQCDMDQSCCVANGPRALMLLPQLAVMEGEQGPVVNFYGPMTARAEAPGAGTVELDVQSNYPESDTIRIVVRPEHPSRFPLSLRIPDWSVSTKIAVDDGPCSGVVAGRYYLIDREWRPGDAVHLQLDLRARVVRAPGDPSYSAILRGPIVLARDERLGGSVDAPVHLAAGASGVIALHSIPNPAAGIWMTFAVPLSDGGVLRMCDYASAGNSWTDASRLRVWLP